MHFYFQISTSTLLFPNDLIIYQTEKKMYSGKTICIQSKLIIFYYAFLPFFKLGLQSKYEYLFASYDHYPLASSFDMICTIYNSYLKLNA